MRKLEDLNKSYFGPRVSDGAGVYVAGFVFMWIFNIAMTIIAIICNMDMKNLPNWFTQVANALVQVSFVFSVFIYGVVAHKPLLQECKIERKLHWKQAVIIPLIAIVGIMAFLPLATGFVELIEFITQKKFETNVTIGDQWWEILISIVVFCLLPAIGEEILFRGGVARGLKRKNYLFAIIMSGFMFSIFHGSAAQTVHQFFIGMVFAYLYFVTGSLLASMLAHFANNALALALGYLPLDDLSKVMPLGAEIALWIVISIIGFVAMYFLLRYMMKISKEVKGLPQNQDKMAWAKDLGNAFSARGIKDNYSRFNSSLKMLFDDLCDDLNIDGDIVKDTPSNEIGDSADDNQNGMSATESKSSSASEMDKLLAEANKQTISKRKRFDIMALVVAIGIALVWWIIMLIQRWNLF